MIMVVGVIGVLSDPCTTEIPGNIRFVVAVSELVAAICMTMYISNPSRTGRVDGPDDVDFCAAKKLETEEIS